jgi:rhodanese-related sulfurtransferase
LKKNGFTNVVNYSGGMKEWLASKGRVVKNEEMIAIAN